MLTRWLLIAYRDSDNTWQPVCSYRHKRTAESAARILTKTLGRPYDTRQETIP